MIWDAARKRAFKNQLFEQFARIGKALASGSTVLSGSLTLVGVAPGLFAQNGNSAGVAAGTYVRASALNAPGTGAPYDNSTNPFLYATTFFKSHRFSIGEPPNSRRPSPKRTGAISWGTGPRQFTTRAVSTRNNAWSLFTLRRPTTTF
jgi:hypothetical protein